MEESSLGSREFMTYQAEYRPLLYGCLINKFRGLHFTRTVSGSSERQVPLPVLGTIPYDSFQVDERRSQQICSTLVKTHPCEFMLSTYRNSRILLTLLLYSAKQTFLWNIWSSPRVVECRTC